MTKTETNNPMTIETADSVLRAAGWVVHPPASDEIPEPQVGQVWVSPKPRVEPRTVVGIDLARGWQMDWVAYTKPGRPPHPRYSAFALHLRAFRKWARTSGARPVQP